MMQMSGLQHTEDSVVTVSKVDDEVRAWLEAFADAVRRVDYEAGRRLFSPDVVGFGTVGILMEGLDRLVNSQWKRVWGVTTGYRFDFDRLTCRTHGDIAWAAALWTSTARDRNGQPYERRGRATYLLQRCNGRWLAIHTHHSLDPSGTAPNDVTH